MHCPNYRAERFIQMLVKLVLFCPWQCARGFCTHLSFSLQRNDPLPVSFFLFFFFFEGLQKYWQYTLMIHNTQSSSSNIWCKCKTEHACVQIKVVCLRHLFFFFFFFSVRASKKMIKRVRLVTMCTGKLWSDRLQFQPSDGAERWSISTHSYARAHTHTHTHTRTHTHTYTRTHTHTHARAHKHTHNTHNTQTRTTQKCLR